MKNWNFLSPLCFVLCVTALVQLSAQTVNANTVRPPAVAVAFYPAHPELLKAAIADFMKDARPKAIANPLAIIVPHAGYVFSGQTFADAFNQAKDGKHDVVVVLGTNQTRCG